MVDEDADKLLYEYKLIEKENLYIMDKEYEYKKIDKYISMDSFSDLFSNFQGTPSQSQLDFRGRPYDANAMWSPQSLAGTVYEWNRGVMGIAFDGTFEKENLDGTLNHHADATVRVVNKLGVNIDTTTAPFEAGLNGAKEGIVVFQSEGNNAFVYFPPSISLEQLSVLETIVTPRGDFNFSFTYGEQIFEEQDYQGVLDFAVRVYALANSRRTMR